MEPNTNAPEIKFRKIPDKLIGQHVKLLNAFIFDKGINPTEKLIYSFLLSRINWKTGVTQIPTENIKSVLGYSRPTIIKAINGLYEKGWLKITRLRLSKEYARNYANRYEFPKQPKGNISNYARLTKFFLDDPNLTHMEKEFILLIFPYLNSDGEIGSIDNPMSTRVIGRLIGVSNVTVHNRIHDLKDKGLLETVYECLDWTDKETIVGYVLDITTIMLRSIEHLQQELARLLEERRIHRRTKINN